MTMTSLMFEMLYVQASRVIAMIHLVVSKRYPALPNFFSVLFPENCALYELLFNPSWRHGASIIGAFPLTGERLENMQNHLGGRCITHSYHSGLHLQEPVHSTCAPQFP